MKVQEFYDSFSEKYDEKINSKSIDSKLMEEVVSVFDKYKFTSGSILDVGCGTGILKEYLGNKFNYTGIDISNNMLSIAKSRGYEIISGEMLQNLERLENNSSDFVVCISALYWTKDAEKIIEEMKRISKKAVLFTLEEIEPVKLQHSKSIDESPVYDHSNMQIPLTKEDYKFSAWTSPTAGIRINARMVLILTS